MKDDYNYRETPYSRQMEGADELDAVCPHGLLVRDEDCPDCAEEADDAHAPALDDQHDTREEWHGQR